MSKSNDKWKKLKSFLIEYKEKMSKTYGDSRYCIALSIDDLIEKMDEIEKNE